MAKSKTSPAKVSETPLEVPEFVALRFIAIAAGQNYAQITNMISRSGVRLGQGRLRHWEDAQRRIGKKVLSGDVLQLVLKHVAPQLTVTEPVEVPGDVFKTIRAAWKAIGAPGCSMLRSKDAIEEEILGDRSNMSLEEVRIASQVEQLRFKKMQSKRLLAMMCDRKSVEAEMLQISMKVQRWMRTIPASITGVLVEFTSLSDSELRAVEKRLQDALPPMLREIRQDFAEVAATAAEVAAARRYADRGVASLPGKP